ncbi:hypothetical protein ACFXAE_29705 [Streptomyces sp. NPDC059454]|jgi:hypothetical protein|uniref:hypothetical protein n=1 Tax=Streptomyces sp. NPDC059454 TaxID=3346836 RepID=UPI0036BA61DA
MVTSKKIAAVAGVLGSLALVGAGAGHAFAESEPAKCVEDDKGNVRCVLVSEYRFTDKDGKVQVVSHSSQTCSGSGYVSCSSNVVLPAKKS